MAASQITDRETLIQGGATSPTFEVYRRESGRVRVFWYYFDQDGARAETVATFREADWPKAVGRAREHVRRYLEA